jgi:N-acyl-D-amino-acid deacylase
MDDLLIRGARIHDGLGSEPRRADVTVRHGRVASITDAARRAGRHPDVVQVVDADGLSLMPGIVDSHTHYDAQITWDPTLAPSPALGVTTCAIGNCGFTIAPCRPAHRELTMRNLTQVEGMSLEVLRQGIHWGFESFAEYVAQLRAGGSVPNVAAYVGHSSVRTWVMGEDAHRREATRAEIAEMAQLVRDAMAAGAIGLASSTSPAHNGEAGIPMPSRLASDAEFEALVGAMAEAGHGSFMLTKGGHTRMAFLESLAAASGRPVMVAALLHNPTNPDGVFRDLAAIAEAQARGRQLVGQVSCCPLTMDFTLASPYPVEGLAGWKPLLGLRGVALRRALADRSLRDALRAELATTAAFRLFNGEWHKLRVVEVQRPALRRLEQRTIAEIAADPSSGFGPDPLDAWLDLALADQISDAPADAASEAALGTVFTAELLNSDEAAVTRLISDPNAVVSLSDAGAHLTFFNDAAFGLHLLGHWSRDRGAMPLAEAVRRLTSMPADLLGLGGSPQRPGRGRLVPGAPADLLLFDPKRVGRGPKRRVFDLPGGAPRLHTDGEGVQGVWVNGRRVADASGMRPDAPRAGRLLTPLDPG